MRQLNTDNLIGVVFIKLLQENKIKIDLKYLKELERNVDNNLRDKTDTFLYITRNDINNIVDYYNFFELDYKNHCIKLTANSIKDYNSNKEYFLDVLDSYFKAGIPKDILKTLEITV